jgi:Domain of unknown function (DUF1992)
MPDSHESQPSHEPQGGPGQDRTPARDARTGRSAAANRIQQQQTWVDLQVRKAMERGEFDNLPGKGKPIEGLGRDHDPDWWLKKLVERERIVVLPPSVQLRKEDAELDATLDALHYEDAVRRHVEDFHKRVIAARYRLPEGPPLVTMPRDVEATVAGWQERREARRTARAAQLAAQREEAAPQQRSRWTPWRRRRQR